MSKPHTEQGTPTNEARTPDRGGRHIIDLPRPTLDQQQFLGQLESSASKYDPNVLVCGKKLGS